jgi:hypothetical protein
LTLPLQSLLKVTTPQGITQNNSTTVKEVQDRRCKSTPLQMKDKGMKRKEKTVSFMIVRKLFISRIATKRIPNGWEV